MLSHNAVAKDISAIHKEEPLKPLLIKQPLTIAINETSFPYHSINKQGNAIGVMSDMWRLWAKKQQVEIKFVVLPWDETLSEVANNNVDIHGGLSIIESRKKRLLFSAPLFPVYTHLYINKKLSNINVLADLKPYSLGVVKAAGHLDNIKKYHPEFALKTYENRIELYRGALNDEVLVFTGLEKLADNFDEYDALLKKFPAHKVIRYKKTDYGVAVAKDNVQLLNFIEEGFKKISKKERADIERKWLGLEKKKDSLLIAFSPDYPPYMSVNSSGEAQGLLIDVWRLWSKEMGINIEFFPRKMADSLSLVAEQKADVLLAYPSHVKTLKKITFANPIYASNAQVYLSNKIRDDEGNRLVSLDQFTAQFNDGVIGIWQDATFKSELLSKYPKLKLRSFPDFRSMLKAIDTDEISGIVGLVDLISTKLIQDHLLTLLYRLNSPEITLTLSPALYNGNDKLLEIINRGFGLLDSHELVDIEKTWLIGMTTEHYYKQQAKKIVLTPEEKSFLTEHKKIKLGIIKGLSPMEFIDEKNELSGVTHDITNLVSQSTGLEFNYIVFENWQQLYKALIDGKVDMIGNITPTLKRREKLLFTDSYWEMPWVMVHPQYDGRKTKLEEFYGKRVAIIKGYYLLDKLRVEHPLINFTLVANRDEALVELQQERIDGFITTLASGSHLTKHKHNINLMLSMMEGTKVETNHFAISKRLPALKEIVNKGLLSITEEDNQTIYDQWFTLSITTGFDKRMVFQVGIQISIIILLILGVIIMWNRRLQVEINHRDEMQKMMKHMATHDELTGLANRVLLKDRLNNAIELHERQSLEIAVLFIDLDGFKIINDTHGHAIGDELLQQVALRLLGCVRASDTVARFGGDEFIILLTGLNTPNEAKSVVEKVLELIQKEFILSTENVFIGCSVGIAMYPHDGDNDVDLVRVADSMMYKVKAQGKNSYSFSDNDVK